MQFLIIAASILAVAIAGPTRALIFPGPRSSAIIPETPNIVPAPVEDAIITPEPFIVVKEAGMLTIVVDEAAVPIDVIKSHIEEVAIVPSPIVIEPQLIELPSPVLPAPIETAPVVILPEILN